MSSFFYFFDFDAAFLLGAAVAFLAAVFFVAVLFFAAGALVAVFLEDAVFLVPALFLDLDIAITDFVIFLWLYSKSHTKLFLI